MITKFQRHPTDPACLILHISGIGFPPGYTIDVVNQAYRNAIEAAGKAVD